MATEKATYELTTILVQGEDQEMFEVYVDSSREQTLGFVTDEQTAVLLASAPTLLAAAEAVQAYFTEKYGGDSTKELARIRTALDTAIQQAKGGAE